MSDSVTKQDIQHLEKRLDKRFEVIDKHFKSIDKRFKNIDKRFEVIDKRFEGIDKRFEVIDKRFDDLIALMSQFANDTQARFKEIDKRFDKVDKAYQQLLGTMDSFLKRIDSYETERAARDVQFERLVEWAHKVSAKTGIPLENL